MCKYNQNHRMTECTCICSEALKAQLPKKILKLFVHEKIDDKQAHQYTCNWKIYYLIVILNHYLFNRIRNKI